ncbi:MAG: LacI family DNA-binding transcriptional regulator [Pirellulaceae bacterium]
MGLGEGSGLTTGSEVSALPKYEQLREYVVSQIESGSLKAGAALPSENRLAESLQVARSTVRQALAALEKDGLVCRIHGKGTFVHDEAKQRLRKSQDLYALVVPETDTAFYPSLQRSFERAAAELHNQVIVCNSNNDIDKQASAILQLIDLKVAGVAIVPTTTTTPAFHVRQLQKHGIPVVCCSRPVAGAEAPLIAIPFEDVGIRAGEELRKAGHRSVAFFTSGVSQASTAYLKGLKKAVGEGVHVSSFGPTDTAAIDTPRIAAACATALDKMLESDNPPTAIFCGFDSLAENLYVLAAQRGLRVPQDISIIGFGGRVRGSGLASHLASVTVDEVGLGQQAVELLSRMRKGELPLDSSEVRKLPLSFNTGSTLAAYAPANHVR